MRFSGMGGGVTALGNEWGSQYSGYKPIFQCIGMEKICRSCRIEIEGRGLGSAPCHVSYRGLFGGIFLFLLCPRVEGGGLCIDRWVFGISGETIVDPWHLT